MAAALERGALTGTQPDFAAVAATCDTLVLAGPLEAVLAQLAALGAGLPHPPLVLDVASVKVPVVAAGEAVAGFVATHPLAGSERSGPLAARADLFAGRTWTYEPTARPGPRAAARTFLAALGARPLAVAAARHDAIVALTSHLPQLLSSALGARLAAALPDDAVAELCGPGIGSMLRLAGSPWPTWRPILAANAPGVAQEVRAMANVLLELAAALDSGAVDRLEPLFATAADAAARVATPPADSRFSP